MPSTSAGSVHPGTHTRWLSASSSWRSGRRTAFGQWLYTSTAPTAWPIPTTGVGVLAHPSATNAAGITTRSCMREIRALKKQDRALKKHVRRDVPGRHRHPSRAPGESRPGRPKPPTPIKRDEFISSREQGARLETVRPELYPKRLSEKPVHGLRPPRHY